MSRFRFTTSSNRISRKVRELCRRGSTRRIWRGPELLESRRPFAADIANTATGDAYDPLSATIDDTTPNLTDCRYVVSQVLADTNAPLSNAEVVIPGDAEELNSSPNSLAVDQLAAHICDGASQEDFSLALKELLLAELAQNDHWTLESLGNSLAGAGFVTDSSTGLGSSSYSGEVHGSTSSVVSGDFSTGSGNSAGVDRSEIITSSGASDTLGVDSSANTAPPFLSNIPGVDHSVVTDSSLTSNRGVDGDGLTADDLGTFHRDSALRPDQEQDVTEPLTPVTPVLRPARTDELRVGSLPLFARELTTGLTVDRRSEVSSRRLDAGTRSDAMFFSARNGRAMADWSVQADVSVRSGVRLRVLGETETSAINLAAVVMPVTNPDRVRTNLARGAGRVAVASGEPLNRRSLRNTASRSANDARVAGVQLVREVTPENLNLLLENVRGSAIVGGELEGMIAPRLAGTPMVAGAVGDFSAPDSRDVAPAVVFSTVEDVPSPVRTAVHEESVANPEPEYRGAAWISLLGLGSGPFLARRRRRQPDARAAVPSRSP